MDGEINYSQYSLRELREAESHIARDRYPKNYTNLQQEIQRRLRDDAHERSDPASSSERVWAKPRSFSTVPEIATSNLVKYTLSFVAVATVLDVVATSILRANGYSFGHLPRIFHYSVAGMIVGWMFASGHGRLFYRSEVEQLIALCLAGIILLDLTMSTLFMIFVADMPPMSFGVVLWTAVSLFLVYLFDLALIFFAYRVPTRLLMLRLLKGQGDRAAV